MRRYRAQFIWITVLLIAICSPAVARGANYLFSLRGIHLKDGERVVGLDVSLKAGDFVAVSGLPSGWTTTIDNNPSWQTSLKGTAEIGAAALSVESIQKLRLVVHRFEFGDLKFRISGKLLVTTDFVNLRKVPLEGGNFEEVPSGPSER